MFFALTLYGVFSAPAPSALEPAEMAVAAFLVLAVGVFSPLCLLTSYALHARPPRVWVTVGVLSVHLLLWPPLLRGVAMHGDINAIVRDVTPLLYLWLPLLLGARLSSGRAVSILAAGLAVAGVAFTFRWWSDAQWAFGALGRRPLRDGALYLLNDPSVLFAAVWLPCWGWSRLIAPTASWAWRLAGLLMMLLGGLSVLALVGAVHRTAMVLGGACGVVFLTRVWSRAPIATPALIGALLAAEQMIPGTPLLGALQRAADKTQLVGWNARAAEIEAVWACATADFVSFVIGEGWGAMLANPAVGGWRVGYTHSFPSYLLFKTGLVGLFAAAAWFATLVPVILRAFEREFLISLALIPPLLTGLFLHTSFKYLSFGVILLLFVVIGRDAPDPIRESSVMRV